MGIACLTTRKMAASAGLCLLLLAVGCAPPQEGPARFRISGKVQYQGKPVPAGLVIFTPDSTQGNSGPQGIAIIDAGRFDTSGEGGKHVVAGPHVVKVIGTDGVIFRDETGQENQAGKPLFSPWTSKVIVSDDRNVHDFEIP